MTPEEAVDCALRLAATPALARTPRGYEEDAPQVAAVAALGALAYLAGAGEAGKTYARAYVGVSVVRALRRAGSAERAHTPDYAGRCVGSPGDRIESYKARGYFPAELGKTEMVIVEDLPDLSRPDAEHVVRTRERAERVRARLAVHLGADGAAGLLVRLAEEISPAEVAEVSGEDVGAVYARWRNLRKQLRQDAELRRLWEDLE